MKRSKVHEIVFPDGEVIGNEAEAICEEIIVKIFQNGMTPSHDSWSTIAPN